MKQVRRYREDKDVAWIAVSVSPIVGLVGLFLVIRGLVPFAVLAAFVVAMYVFGLPLLIPTVRIRVGLSLTVVPVRALASWGLTLLGPRASGNPVKWTALILFIVGSLFDLIWG